MRTVLISIFFFHSKLQISIFRFSFFSLPSSAFQTNIERFPNPLSDVIGNLHYWKLHARELKKRNILRFHIWLNKIHQKFNIENRKCFFLSTYFFRRQETLMVTEIEWDLWRCFCWNFWSCRRIWKYEKLKNVKILSKQFLKICWIKNTL